MSSQVTLPRLGQGMESGTIVRWLKAEGDQVEKGEPLYELDTEKVTQEVEADSSGTLLKILAGEGEEIEVGKAIAVIGEPGEGYSPPEPDDSNSEEVPAAEQPDEPRLDRLRQKAPMHAVAGDAGELVQSRQLRIDGTALAEPFGQRLFDELGGRLGRDVLLHRASPGVRNR